MSLKETNRIDLDASLIKAPIPKANESEFKHFMYLFKEYNFDPLKKEIYLMRYGGKCVAITSRDSYLKIANLHPLNFLIFQ